MKHAVGILSIAVIVLLGIMIVGGIIVNERINSLEYQVEVLNDEISSITTTLGTLIEIAEDQYKFDEAVQQHLWG